MSTASLLAKLHAAGVTISSQHGRLIVEGPSGSVTADLHAELVKRKSELLTALEVAQERPEEPVLKECRREIAALLALAYHRYSAIQRIPDSTHKSDDDELVIPPQAASTEASWKTTKWERKHRSQGNFNRLARENQERQHGRG